MTDLYENLKQNNSSQTIQEEAGKRLKNIIAEVDSMKRAMEDKDKKIQGSPPVLIHACCSPNGTVCMHRRNQQR